MRKGGYVFGAETFTVKLACVSFYKNVTERNLPAGSGVFVVVDAAMGCPLGIFQENRVSKCTNNTLVLNLLCFSPHQSLIFKYCVMEKKISYEESKN